MNTYACVHWYVVLLCRVRLVLMLSLLRQLSQMAMASRLSMLLERGEICFEHCAFMYTQLKRGCFYATSFLLCVLIALLLALTTLDHLRAIVFFLSLAGICLLVSCCCEWTVTLCFPVPSLDFSQLSLIVFLSTLRMLLAYVAFTDCSICVTVVFLYHLLSCVLQCNSVRMQCFAESFAFLCLYQHLRILPRSFANANLAYPFSNLHLKFQDLSFGFENLTSLLANIDSLSIHTVDADEEQYKLIASSSESLNYFLPCNRVHFLAFSTSQIAEVLVYYAD